jgi:hypothetical protein
MILDPTSDFDRVRLDTLASMLRDPQLVFYYGAGAARIALDLISEITYTDDASLEDDISIINEALGIVRGVVPFDRGLNSDDIVNRLRDEVGDLADTYASLVGVVSFEAECVVPTSRTVTCPVRKSVVLESKLSDSYAVGRLEDSEAISLGGSGYLTAGYIAKLLKGEVRTERELGRGRGTEALLSFVSTHAGPWPFSLRTREAVWIIHAVTSDLVSSFVSESSSDRRWVATLEYVSLPRGRGRTGPLYVWDPQTVAVVPELYVREGDMLAGAPSATVVSVEGATVKFDGGVRLSGEATFVNKSRELWYQLSPEITDVTLLARTFEERVKESALALSGLSNTLERLTRAFYKVRATTPSDIRAAHYAVGADYACGLLESGDFKEYSDLCPCADSSSKILSAATSRARAGVRS